MKGSFISVNELRFLAETLNEVKENGDSTELDNAIEMVDGFINESIYIAHAELLEMLEKNENAIKTKESIEDVEI